MNHAEEFILENQATILSLLSEICQNMRLSNLALERVELIQEQITKWNRRSPK